MYQSEMLSLQMEHNGTTFPAWYKLRFVPPGTIVFLVQESVQSWFDEIHQRYFVPDRNAMAELGIKSYAGPREEVWGYENSICTVSTDEVGWMRYEIELPAQNRGEDGNLLYQGDSFSYAAALSISHLVRALNGVRYDHIVNHEVPQLLTFQNYVDKRDMSGAMMGAYYSRYIAEWTQSHGRDPDYTSEISLAMKRSYCHMIPPQHIRDEFWWQKEWEEEFYSDDNPYSLLRFPVEVYSDIYLSLEIGKDVSLGAEGSRFKPNDINLGYKLDVRNPDSVVQQLNLIAGMAKLYEVVERWYLKMN